MVRMRSWIVLGLSMSLCVPLLAQEPCTITVLPGESIQAAIDAAPEGAVICLAEGEWTEHIALGKSLTLRGVGAEHTTIRGYVKDVPVVALQAPEGDEVVCFVEGVTITGGSGWYGPGVHVAGTPHVTLRSCALIGNERDTLWVDDHADVTLEDCRFEGGSNRSILVAESAKLTAAACVIRGSLYAVWATGATTVVITDSAVTGNAWGISLGGAVHAQLTGNLIEGNGGFGVSLVETACWPSRGGTFTGYVSGKGNTIRNNGRGETCPTDLSFLTTEEGGELDRRE